jgi:hypothetical protein
MDRFAADGGAGRILRGIDRPAGRGECHIGFLDARPSCR